MSPRYARAALVVVLLVAAGLRFTGLAWGLRHAADWDERVFVENAALMAARHDLDHRFYEYPGLFFTVLAPVLAAVGVEEHAGPSAYLAARAVVAAFGVLAVFLTYFVGARLIGASAGLFAAALLAVSPVDVWTAHMVRPDVVLQAFVMLAFLTLHGIGERRAADLRAGAAVGAAVAVKFTGLLLVPSYLAARLLAPGRRVRGAILAGAAALAVALLATPYAILHHQAFLRGVAVQWTAHYDGGSSWLRVPEGIVFCVRILLRTLGPVGFALCAWGAVRTARDGRRFMPLGLFALLLLSMQVMAQRRYDRLLVPAIGVLAVIAALGMSSVAARRTRLAAVVAAAALAFPLATSIGYLRQIRTPSTWDRALDFIEANAPPGTRILTNERELGLDRRRFQVVMTQFDPSLDGRLIGEADLVIAAPDPDLPVGGLQRRLNIVPARPEDGQPIAIYAVPATSRPAYRPVSLAGARFTASEAGDTLELMRDGRPDTEWRTAGPQQPGQWVQIDLTEPVYLARLELVLGSRGQRRGRDVHVLVTRDGQSWTRVRAAPGRPPIEEQPGEGQSEVFILDPVEARGLRLVQNGRDERRWGIAELRLDALPALRSSQP